MNGEIFKMMRTKFPLTALIPKFLIVLMLVVNFRAQAQTSGSSSKVSLPGAHPAKSTNSPNPPTSPSSAFVKKSAPAPGASERDEESEDESDEDEADLQAEENEKLELPQGDELVSETDPDEINADDEDGGAGSESEEALSKNENTESPSSSTASHEVRRMNPSQAHAKSAVEEEEALQRKIIERKSRGESRDSSHLVKNRFPETKPLFKLPPGPKNGGTVKMSHPNSNKGLVSISSDGIYQYKTKIKERTQSSSFKVSMMTPPTIDSGNSAITYESMYGNSNIVALKFDYEWEPFSTNRNWGLKMGGGIAMASGQGFFKNESPNRTQSRAEEKYTLYMVPATLMINYRFEYSKRQWLVPYVLGGVEGYGLAEIRSDNRRNNFAWSASAGGGGGLLLPISRIDKQQAFTISEEYGISDMWLSIEGVYMQGLVSEVDFTHQQINVGVQVDF